MDQRLDAPEELLRQTAALDGSCEVHWAQRGKTRAGDPCPGESRQEEQNVQSKGEAAVARPLPLPRAERRL